METDSDTCDQGHIKSTNYSEFMTHCRFKDVNNCMAYVFADSLQEHSDAWWKIIAGIDGFNNNRTKLIQSLNIKVVDKRMPGFFHILGILATFLIFITC